MFQISCLESDIIVGSVAETGLSKLLTDDFGNCKKAILVDSNTNELCLPHLLMHIDGLSEAEIIELPAGEENKSMEMCFSVWEALSEMEFGRNDLLICLGGGVICDMGGFIASIYKRGMSCFYIPTSLLALTDASVGGKTGIDLGPFKNQLGVFASPSKVFSDISFLETLPNEEKVNGLAEMLKHGLIAKLIHFEEVERTPVDQITAKLIQDSVRIKAEIVSKDPIEKGSRKLLNFGHTVGHAIEGALLNSPKQMSHGLAVAHGMLVEAEISVAMHLLPRMAFTKIEEVLRSKFEFQSFDDNDLERFMELMRQDKKRVESTSRYTLLKGIGEGVYDVQVSDDIVRKALKVLSPIDSES